jgi:hypothetical protein
VDANPTGFDNPVATFTIFGNQLTTLAGNISGNLSVTPPGQLPTDQTITLSFSITGNVITVTNVTFEGSYDLPIGFDVTEKNLDTVPVPVHRTGTATVPFTTKVHTLDPGSQDFLEQCARETARFHAGALREEIGHLPHGDGDPPPILERIQELYLQLVETRVTLRGLRLARGNAFGARALPRRTPAPFSASDSTSE